MQKKRRRATRLAFIYLTAAALTLGVLAGTQYERAQRWQRQAANGYRHAFDELVTAVGEMDSALEKSLYATGPGMVAVGIGAQFWAPKALDDFMDEFALWGADLLVRVRPVRYFGIDLRVGAVGAWASESYWYDGYEGSFDPDMPETITLDCFPSQEEDAEQPPEPESVRTSDKQEGDPLYKIITSDTWYLALKIDSQYMDRYAMGSRIEVSFDKATVDATINRITQYENAWVVLAYTNRYYEDSARLRFCDVTIITEDHTGLLIPTTARAMQEQEDGSMLEGVYVKNIRGDYVFRRVSVLAEDEESGETLVAADTFYEKNEEGETVQVSTIGVYDEVLRDAGGLSDVNVTDDEEPEEEEIVFEWEKVKEEPQPEPEKPEEGE